MLRRCVGLGEAQCECCHLVRAQRRDIEALRAERDAWKTAAMGASTQAVRLREQIIEWAKSHQDDPRTAAEDALLSVAYGDYSARASFYKEDE